MMSGSARAFLGACAIGIALGLAQEPVAAAEVECTQWVNAAESDLDPKAFIEFPSHPYATRM